MPRTKKPAPKPKAPRLADSEEAARKKQLDEIVEEQKQALDHGCEVEINNIQLAFRILVSSLSKETLHKTIGQMKTELALRDRPPSFSGRRAVSQDDGYLTEGSQPDTATRRRPSRSATRHADLSQDSTQPYSRSGRRSRSTEVRPTTARPRPQTASAFKTPGAYRTPATYKTPAIRKNALNTFPTITPKVVPNTPLKLMRMPRQGEMAVSMSGSPLMVHPIQAEEKTNCNIQLIDGTVLSLQPEAFRESDIKSIPVSLMNEQLMHQVNTLQKNLATVVKLGAKNGLR